MHLFDVKQLEMGCSPHRICPITGPRLFFVIYYKNDKQPQFRYAAETWREEVKLSDGFVNNSDIFLALPVYDENNLKDAWANVALQASLLGLQVWCGNILTHASTVANLLGVAINSGQLTHTGLEFPLGGGLDDESPGTLTSKNVGELPKLPWNRRFGYMILSGCMTGRDEGRAASPAAAFARRQGVPVVGQSRAASFSAVRGGYKQITPKDRKIYLWAYDKSAVSDVGSQGVPFAACTGYRVPGVVHRSLTSA